MQSSSPTCNTCNSKLILVSQTTEKLDGSRFPQTTTVYRCSNQECQDEKDKATAKRVKAQADKDLLTKKRLESKNAEKKVLEKIESEEAPAATPEE